MLTNMKRTIILSCSILLLAVVFTVSMYMRTSATNETLYSQKEEEALAFTNGFLESAGVNSFAEPMDPLNFEEMLDSNLIGVENENYVFLFDEDSVNLRSIITKATPDIPLLGQALSESAAVSEAEALAVTLCPDFFTAYSYDVICNEINSDGNGNSKYSIELLEKIDDKFYTGNKIAIMMEKNGNLLFLLKINESAGYTAGQTGISEDEAIEIAYGALPAMIEKLETNEWPSDADISEKTGNDVIVSDAGIVSSESEIVMDEYRIILDDTSVHTVEASRQMKGDRVLWVVEISNVKTNRPWNMGFFVAINAESGDVEYIDHTR